MALTLGPVLSRGDTTEVLMAHDDEFEREVVVKRVTVDSPIAHARLMTEARVQGRLEHPCVVPAYGVGLDELGRPYFIMKRLSGVTLAQAGDVPRARLADLALALELAHSRGIVHGAVERSHVFLGDFGEVYLLSWRRSRLEGGDPAIDVRALAAIAGVEVPDGLTARGLAERLTSAG